MANSVMLWFNFEQTRAVNKKTGNFDKTMLFGKLEYQQMDTKIIKDGRKWIARTKRQLCDLNGKEATATTDDINYLVQDDLIYKRSGLWKDVKRVFISCNSDYRVGLNAKKQEMLDKYTGSTRKSALLALFAFYAKDKGWAMVSKKSARTLLCATTKTVTSYLQDLQDLGILTFRGRNLWGQGQYQVTINPGFTSKIEDEWEAIESAQNLILVEKSGASTNIIINNNDKVDKNNNTVPPNAPRVNDEGIIILSKKEQNYLGEAVKRTLARCTVLSWTYETLMGHMRYVLTTPKNRNSAQNFVHCVNRAMLLVREGKWNQPFGYDKYSFEGVSERARLDGLADEHLCVEGKRRRDENEQRVKQLEERKMYEKDEDEGNVGFQFKMAKDIFKPSPTRLDNIQRNSGGSGPMHSLPAQGAGPILNEVQKRIAAGTNGFESHEDVMVKLLGKV